LNQIRTRKVATDIETTRAFIRASLPTEEQPWNERWAILLRQTAEDPSSEKVGVVDETFKQRDAGKLRMIGIIGIVREQEIGYKLHPDFWGKGYMSEALAMFIEMWWGMESMILPILSPG
jgi:ribosomal-protein-alanine N-acetyltransferase